MNPALTLPAVVMLRNRRFATVQTLVGDCPPFVFLGRLSDNPPPGHVIGDDAKQLNEHNGHQLWTAAGRWLPDRRHELDIIGVKQADGNFHAFAAAAGASPQ